MLRDETESHESQAVFVRVVFVHSISKHFTRRVIYHIDKGVWTAVPVLISLFRSTGARGEATAVFFTRAGGERTNVQLAVGKKDLLSCGCRTKVALLKRRYLWRVMTDRSRLYNYREMKNIHKCPGADHTAIQDHPEWRTETDRHIILTHYSWN